MTKFEGGPADKKILLLSRAPFFLRVTQGPGGSVDALDLLEDQPEASELITVYRKVKDEGCVHITRSVNGRRAGSWHAAASYALYEHQPADAVARDPAQWRRWCEEQAQVMRERT